MKPSRSHILLLLFVLACTASAQPPKPGEGYRWMLNQPYSDEFNGTELDLTKWYNYHPYWQGRPPAKFMPSQVSVKDGMLVLRNKKLENSEPGDTWTIAGAAVVSRGITAHYGYYECSQKASKIRMSSTFWMASRGFPGPEPCSDKYSQELDIQEAVGGAKSSFNNTMHSNSHYNYTDCSGVKTNYSAGAQIPLKEGEVSDTFHVYAAHWKNANSADLYLDGAYGNAITFRTTIDDTPFENPMHINMVTETYDWVDPPEDEDLADSSINATYIDWIRSWKLVPVDFQEESPGLIENGGFETGDFSYWTGWGGNPLEVVGEHVHSGNYAAHIGGPGAPEYLVNLRAYTSYTLSCYGKVVAGSGPIFFGIKDPSEKVLGSVEVNETEYTKKSFQFTTESSGLSLKFYFYAPNSSAEGYADDFNLVLNDPSDTLEQEEISIFDEQLSFDEKPKVLPAAEQVKIRLEYQSNGDRSILLKLLDADSVLMGENFFPAYAGYGLKTVELSLDSVPDAGEGYRLIAELFFPDSLSGTPIDRDVLNLALQDPVKLSLSIVDVRNKQAIEGALVRLNDKSGLTNQEGYIEFQNVPPGLNALLVQKEGFDDLQLQELEIFRDTVLTLSMLPETRRFSITVTDDYTGDPVASASVLLGDQTELTNSNGEALFLNYAGAYSLQIMAEKYHSARQEVEFFADTSLQLELNRSLADLKFVIKKEGSSLYKALVTVGDKSEYTSTIGLAFIPDLKTDSTLSYRVEYENELLAEDSLMLQTDSTIRLDIYAQGDIQTASSRRLQIYPNPAGDKLYVSGLTGERDYTISNAAGAVLQKGEVLNQLPIDISFLKKGIYFVSFGQKKPLKMIKY